MKQLSLLYSILVLLLLTTIPLALALSSPVIYNGKTYYVVTSTDASEDSGDEVCKKAGGTCVGYTEPGNGVCLQYHPTAATTSSSSGDESGVYCNGPPQTGACSTRYHSCHTCPACSVSVPCDQSISGLYREMYVECAGTSTVTPGPITTTTTTTPPPSSSGVINVYSQNVDDAKIYAGWNLVAGYWDLPYQTLNTGTITAGDFVQDAIGWDAKLQDYVFNPTMSSLPPYSDANGFWVYSNTDGYLDYEMTVPQSITGIPLYNGWNVLTMAPFTDVGENLANHLGNCVIAAGGSEVWEWNAASQDWMNNPALVNYVPSDPYDWQRVYVLLIDGDCTLQ
ncbi:hypothetical protein GF342_05120 [Candidatus Woesearchaeota archaeon]|nr:hypothetical protein [Candidatus Woesearchaeota archaeon]